MSKIVPITALVAGTVIDVACVVGSKVVKGQELLVVESMKMQVPEEAPFDGEVVEIFISPGDVVNVDDPLLSIRTA